MNGFIKQVAQVATVMAVMAIAAGCQQPLPNNSPPQPEPISMVKGSASQQLIIKFKPGTITCDPAGIARLSSATQVSLEFVRPMSGDACVVKQFATRTENLSEGQKKLKQHSSIELLEQDAVMKAL
jgi:hypothetical protein